VSSFAQPVSLIAGDFTGVFFLGVLRGKSLIERGNLGAERSELGASIGQPGAGAPVRSQLPALGPRPNPTPPQKPAVLTALLPASVTGKPYTIQLVTHRKKALAEAEVNAIRKKGLTSFIIPSGEYFQVCVGQYSSKEEASKDLAFFQSKHKDSFLRRRP
jgi:cell division septation protein DedD